MVYNFNFTTDQFSTMRDGVVRVETNGLVQHYSELSNLTQERIDYLANRTRHNLALVKFKEDFGEVEGLSKFKSVWYKPPTEFHAKISQIMYGLKYQDICCDKKQAVDNFLASNPSEVINQYILDNGDPVVEQDTINITIS
jgi:hypothetical protein